MAHLVAIKRKNPETGQMEDYYRIGERRDGRQITTALGFLPKKEAARLLKLYEARAAAQSAAAPPPTVKPSAPSVSAWLNDRLLPQVQASGLAAQTVRSAEVSIANLGRLLGAGNIDALTGGDIDRYSVTRRSEGVRGRTIQIELGWLVRSLKLAIKDGLREKMPVFERPHTQDRRPHIWLSAEQCGRLLDALPWKEEPASALAIYLSLDLGCRSGEILSRCWEDVRWDQGSNGAIWIGPRVEGTQTTWETKTKHGRTVPLTGGTRLALQEWWQKLGCPATGWLLPSPRSPLKPLGAFRGALAGACRRAELPELHPHALRHTWATRMAVAGVPKAVTMALGGWRSPAVLESVYQHSISELESEAIVKAAVVRRKGPEGRGTPATQRRYPGPGDPQSAS